MKCKHCDGTGYLKTISVGAVPCSACNGTGEIPITNDEWRKTCSTEEFAKLLSDAMWYGEQCATEGVLCENCKCPWCEGISNWLKQPHREE